MDKITYFWQNRAHYTALILKRIYGLLWKAVNYTSARWWDVKIGKGCKFQGKAKFYRLQDSTITIGNNCIHWGFRTSMTTWYRLTSLSVQIKIICSRH